MVIALIKPSERAKAAMDSLGIAYGATAIRQQGFFEILSKITKAGEENADVIAEIIPNIRALTGVGAMDTVAIEEYHKFLEVVNNNYGEGSFLLKAYEAQMQTAAERGNVFRAGMRAVSIEIGEKLSPVLGGVRSVLLAVAEWFGRNMDVMIKIGKVVVRLTGLWYAYHGVMLLWNSATAANIAITKSLTAAQAIEQGTLKANAAVTTIFIAIKKAYTVATNSQTVATKTATIAQKAWNMAIKANPIGILVTAIGTLVTVLTLLPKKLSAVEKVQNELNEIELNATTSVIDQQFEIGKLVNIIGDETASKQKKLKAQQDLIGISDGYLSTITEETIANGEAKKTIDDYIISLKEKFRIQAIEERIKDIQRQKLKVEAGEDIESTIWQKATVALTGYGSAQAGVAAETRIWAKNRQEILEGLSEEEDVIQA
jgi:hypothetical protein